MDVIYPSFEMSDYGFHIHQLDREWLAMKIFILTKRKVSLPFDITFLSSNISKVITCRRWLTVEIYQLPRQSW